MRAGRARMWTAAALTGLLAAAPFLRAAPPSWVVTFPRDPDAYVGIGRADKRLNPHRYREAAQEAALARIAREISVALRSESRSVRSEDADGARETFDETVTAASSARLSGYERAGTYETESEFWVLYILDKEVHRRTLRDRAGRLLAYLEREAEAVEADLLDRRFQKAADRYAAVARRYAEEYAGEASLRGHSAEPAMRFERLTARVLDATRDLDLEGGDGEWLLDWRITPTPLKPEVAAADPERAGARTSRFSDPLFLADRRGVVHGRGGMAAISSGSLRVTIEDAGSPGMAACPSETDSHGRLDLADAAMRCGLGAGEWTITWMGPGERAVVLRKRIAVRKREVLVVLRGGKADRAVPWLREELALLEVPRHSLVFAPAAPGTRDTLVIQLLDLTRDSLEGMRFSSLRGRVRFPDGAGAAGIVGESGHGDGDRSDRNAARDFARRVEARLSLPGPGFPSSAPGVSPASRPAKAADPRRTSPSRPAPAGWPG